MLRITFLQFARLDALALSEAPLAPAAGDYALIALGLVREVRNDFGNLRIALTARGRFAQLSLGVMVAGVGEKSPMVGEKSPLQVPGITE